MYLSKILNLHENIRFIKIIDSGLKIGARSGNSFFVTLFPKSIYPLLVGLFKEK